MYKKKSYNIIEINNVSKEFKVYQDKHNSIKEKVLFFKNKKYIRKSVLNNINLTINKSDKIAIIGSNGCGKSTLLKLLSKIIYPNKGNIVIKGKVVSLLELGAGFDQEFTGRENIYFNASLFGLSYSEIKKKEKEIISFSELEEYIDNPVRTYSSGMYMRLAFSIAVNIYSDIILIDEVFAVGDINFQKKCIKRLKELSNTDKTLIIVSHDLDIIKQLCKRTIWIKDGTIYMDDKTNIVVNKYMKESD